MIGWLWLALMVVPVFVFVAMGHRYKGLADRHRRPDAPPAPLLNDPTDLKRPELYTDEGNRFRRLARWFYLPVPLAWMALVVALMLILEPARSSGGP